MSPKSGGGAAVTGKTDNSKEGDSGTEAGANGQGAAGTGNQNQPLANGINTNINNDSGEGDLDKEPTSLSSKLPTPKAAGTLATYEAPVAQSNNLMMSKGMLMLLNDPPANTTNVAKVGTVEYATVQLAVNAIAGLASPTGTIIMLADSTEDVLIGSGANITINTANFKLTNATGDTITNNGTLTVTGSGKIENTTNGKAALLNNGKALLSGGTFNRQDATEANSYYTVVNQGEMTIDGATISNGGGYASCLENGWNDSEDVLRTAKLTVKSGEVSGGLNAIKNDAGGELEVKGGKIENSKQYAIMNWNKATVSGGDISCTAAKKSGGAYPAAIINQMVEGDENFAGELIITGGNIKTTQDSTYAVDNWADARISGTAVLTGASSAIQATGASSVTAISGGTLVGAKYYAVTAKNKAKVRIEGGNLSSVNNAVRTQDGETEVNITGGTFASTGSKKHVLYVGKDSKVAVSGGSFSGVGDYYAASVNAGELTVSGGEFSGGKAAIYLSSSDNSIVKISGGDFASTAEGKPVFVKQNATKGSIEVSGGAFSSEIPKEYLVEGASLYEQDEEGNYVVVMDVDKEDGDTSRDTAGEDVNSVKAKTTVVRNDGSPRTGDESNLMVWVSLMSLAAIGLAGTVFYSRKRRIR